MKKTTKKTTKEALGPYLYIGPEIVSPELIIQEKTIVTDIPKGVASLEEAYPELGKLFVPIGQYSKLTEFQVKQYQKLYQKIKVKLEEA